MNYSRYFCNLYQAFLMATNNFKISYITLEILGGNTIYSVPERQEMSLIFSEPQKIITISINTNYEKRHHHTHQDKYYHASEIEALSIKEGFKSPLISLVKEGVDKKTFKDILLITRKVLL